MAHLRTAHAIKLILSGLSFWLISKAKYLVSIKINAKLFIPFEFFKCFLLHLIIILYRSSVQSTFNSAFITTIGKAFQVGLLHLFQIIPGQQGIPIKKGNPVTPALKHFVTKSRRLISVFISLIIMVNRI